MEDKTEAAESAQTIVDQKTIILRKPIKIGELHWDRLELREPTAGELSKAMKAGSDLDNLIMLIQIVAGVVKRVAESLSQRDLQECGDFFASFSPVTKD